MNTEIVQHEVNGFLAHHDDEWFAVLCRLIESQELRTSIGKEGRKTVEDKYSVAANKQTYLTILNSL